MKPVRLGVVVNALVVGLGIIFAQTTIHADLYSGSESKETSEQNSSIQSSTTYVQPVQAETTRTTRTVTTTRRTIQPVSASTTTRTTIIPQAAEVNEGRAVSDFERDSIVITPQTQSQFEQDRILSQRVRQAVNAQPSLSLAAKNIGIQTVNGYVTLTGTVNNTLEKDIIEAKARQTVGVSVVDNRLDTVYP